MQLRQASRARTLMNGQADGANYRLASLDALGRATGAFAKLFEKYPPR